MQGIRDKAASHEVGGFAVASAIRSRILSFHGEWWERPESGIPFDVLAGRMTEEREQIADAYLRERIATTQGVSRIIEYKTSLVGVERRVFVSVLTDEGEEATAEVVL